jgi:hypothetical protein
LPARHRWSWSSNPDRDHRISLSRAGYRRASETVRMQAGASSERSIRLPPLLGDVVVRIEPEEAELLVNGKAVGRGSQTLSLPAVQHRLEVRLDGYESMRASVTPRPGSGAAGRAASADPGGRAQSPPQAADHSPPWGRPCC